MPFLNFQLPSLYMVHDCFSKYYYLFLVHASPCVRRREGFQALDAKSGGKLSPHLSGPPAPFPCPSHTFPAFISALYRYTVTQV
jgi:hypothetical protein